MSTEPTITRRSVIRTGTLGAIVAGLLGTTTTTPIASAVEPAPSSDLVSMLCTGAKLNADESFSEWLEHWNTERLKVQAAHRVIMDQLEALVPDEYRYALIGGCGGLDDVSSDQAMLDAALYRELLIRHMPGMEAAIRLVWEHVATTRLDDLEACDGGFCKDGMRGAY